MLVEEKVLCVLDLFFRRPAVNSVSDFLFLSFFYYSDWRLKVPKTDTPTIAAILWLAVCVYDVVNDVGLKILGLNLKWTQRILRHEPIFSRSSLIGKERNNGSAQWGAPFRRKKKKVLLLHQCWWNHHRSQGNRSIGRFSWLYWHIFYVVRSTCASSWVLFQLYRWSDGDRRCGLVVFDVCCRIPCYACDISWTLSNPVVKLSFVSLRIHVTWVECY